MPCPFCKHPMEGPLDGVLEQSYPPSVPADIWVCAQGGCRVEAVYRRKPEVPSEPADL